MTKYRLNIKLKEKPKQNFWIMNRDAQFFAGLKAGGVKWTDDVKEARTFDDPEKITVLKRWRVEDDPQIVYIEEEVKSKKKKATK